MAWSNKRIYKLTAESTGAVFFVIIVDESSGGSFSYDYQEDIPYLIKSMNTISGGTLASTEYFYYGANSDCIYFTPTSSTYYGRFCNINGTSYQLDSISYETASSLAHLYGVKYLIYNGTSYFNMFGTSGNWQTLLSDTVGIYYGYSSIVEDPTKSSLGSIGGITCKTTPATYTFQVSPDPTYTVNANVFGQWVEGNFTPYDADDPNPGGESGTSDTGGTSDMGGDTIEDTGVPTIQATDSGLMTLYNPDVATLRSLGEFLWSDSLDINSFKKLFNDPFDTLLGLSIVPIQPNHSGTQNIMFGNLDTGISCPVIGNQFVEVDMGTLSLNEVWAGALDYTPNTQVSIYLPFIGERQLNTNDVMNSSIQLKYKFDILTGGCVAQLYVTYNKTGNKKGGDFSFNSNAGFLCSYEGQASINLPLSSMDYTNTIRAMIGAVGMVAGASASFATGNPALGVAALAVGTANSTIQGSSPTVERTGHLSSSNALMDNLQPHLTVCRPHQCKPKYFYQYRGIPSQVYVKNLKSVSGFVQIAEDVHIDAEGATDSELNEIKQLLQEGVII